MGIGIALGVLTAFLQAFSYFFSRHFLVRQGSSGKLLVASQLVLGGIALAIFPFAVPRGVLTWSLAVPLLVCSLCFLIGQFCFFQALKRIEASRIASLMGVKVVLVPLFLYLFFREGFNGGQVTALILALTAAMLMNYQGGGRFQWNGMGFCVLALVCYAWSDIGIRLLVDGIAARRVGIVHAALIGTLCNNVFVAAVLLPGAVVLRVNLRTLRDALPYALCWGSAIFCFFGCFGYLGAAFGNVVQASRGPISLVLGIVASLLGYSYLETRVGRAVWLRRIAAALLMFGAIALYAWASRH